MKRTFSGPEHWLTHVTSRLAPWERKEAQAPLRAQVARWREEGLDDGEIVARLGDAEETANALGEQFVRADEESALRNRLTESPWWLGLTSLVLMGLSMLIESSERGQVRAWNLLIPTLGLLVSLLLVSLRPHLPLRWWLTLSPASGVWLGPLVLIAVAVWGKASLQFAAVVAVGLLVLGVVLRFLLPDRRTQRKMERLERWLLSP